MRLRFLMLAGAMGALAACGPDEEPLEGSLTEEGPIEYDAAAPAANPNMNTARMIGPDSTLGVGYRTGDGSVAGDRLGEFGDPTAPAARPATREGLRNDPPRVEYVQPPR